MSSTIGRATGESSGLALEPMHLTRSSRSSFAMLVYALLMRETMNAKRPNSSKYESFMVPYQVYTLRIEKLQVAAAQEPPSSGPAA